VGSKEQSEGFYRGYREKKQRMWAVEIVEGLQTGVGRWEGVRWRYISKI
jgi:hypothetical protein